MDKPTRTLDDILTRARSEAPVMTKEESRALLASARPERAGETASSNRWRWIMIIGAILATAIGVGIWNSTPVQQTSSNQARSTVEPEKMEKEVLGNATKGKIEERKIEQEERTSQQPKTSTPKAPTVTDSHPKENKDGERASTTKLLLVEKERIIVKMRSVAAQQPSKEFSFEPEKPVDLAGVRMIDPPKWLLDSLGIRVMEDGQVYHDPVPAPFGSIDSVMVRKLPEAHLPLMVANADAPHITSWSLRQHLRTRMITDDRGERRMTMHFPHGGYSQDYSDVILAQHLQDTAKLSKAEVDELIRKVDSARNARSLLAQEQLFNINRLIPIKVTTGDTSYYIFWYNPTAEFLNLLPSPVLVKLRLEATANEIALYDADQDSSARMNDIQQLKTILDSLIDRRIANGETIQQLAEANPGAPIMETSRVSDGAISLYSISPNPNHGEFRVHWAVRETRVVGLSVYDINGNRLQVATSGFRMKADDDEVDVRLKKELPPGMYLLVLSTDRGERAVQRLVIER